MPQDRHIPFRVADDVVGDSFEVFFAQHRNTAAQALALALGDDALGHEAADEAMLRAFRNWKTVATYANPEGWVFRVGLNWGRSRLRRMMTAALKAPLMTSSLSVVRTVLEQAPDPDLAAALEALGPDYRAVVVLRFYRDWPVAQIAEALNIPEGTVKSRLSRAMDQLRNALKEER